MIIDAHVNITPDGRWFNTDHNASVERLLGEMESSGVDRALLISMPGAGDNAHLAELCQKYPEKFRAFGHLTRWDRPQAQMEELLAMGMCGLKVHPRSQGVDVLDPALARFWAFLEERGLPVMIDGYYQNASSGIAHHKLTPHYYDRLARQFSELKIILAHAGAQRLMDAFWVARSHANFYLDISHCLCYYQNTGLALDYPFVLAMADKKIIYGSDFPEYSIGMYLEEFRTVCAKREDIDVGAILSGNIRRLVDFGG